MSLCSSCWPSSGACGEFLILDGGTGSELARRGVPMDARAWSGPAALTHPATLLAVHQAFADAGADILTTNTFGATRFVMTAAGLGAAVPANARAAVRLARQAGAHRERPPVVAGAISNLPPRFDPRAYPPPAVEAAAYRELAELLAEAGVDLLLLEMMEDAEHAPRALEAASASGLPLWVGVSARTHPHDPAGAPVCYDFPQRPLDDVLAALLAVATPDLMAVMHTPPGAVDAASACVGRRFHGPIGAYPELEGAHAIGPDALAAHARRWLASGMRMVGGCCGARPAHIAALARLRGAKGARRGDGADAATRQHGDAYNPGTDGCPTDTRRP